MWFFFHVIIFHIYQIDDFHLTENIVNNIKYTQKVLCKKSVCNLYRRGMWVSFFMLIKAAFILFQYY